MILAEHWGSHSFQSTWQWPPPPDPASSVEAVEADIAVADVDTDLPSPASRLSGVCRRLAFVSGR
jgi:hypothetical protein